MDKRKETRQNAINKVIELRNKYPEMNEKDFIWLVAQGFLVSYRIARDYVMAAKIRSIYGNN